VLTAEEAEERSRKCVPTARPRRRGNPPCAGAEKRAQSCAKTCDAPLRTRCTPHCRIAARI
jgi:hypothetical protein